MTTQDKEAVEAAEKHAHKCFPYNASGDNVRHTILLANASHSFLAGVSWQKQRTVDILKEPPPLGYGMDWYIEKITGKSSERPVNGELEGDD